MTSQPIEANVVLTADNSGYDQAMSGSSTATEKLMTSVDQLTAKISKLTKTAGKSLIGIAAADIAMIGGATKAWSDYEKQMARLNSQAAVLTRSQSESTKVMKDYTAGVHKLRSEMGVTTTEAAKLMETLSKVTGLRQSRDLDDISKVFVQMSKATGESSQGLATSLTSLQRIMGTPVNTKTTKEYADTFTYLAAQTNTSAEGLMHFTSQLAPVAKSLGMNTKEVAGFATAFTQAGQDTGAAATAFTKVSSDMLRSLQSGSPELATYANIVGTTSENFKKLADKDSAEAVVQVFEALSKNSKTASQDLERLGLDGPRTIRAIMSLVNQPGGIRAALGAAEDPRAKGAAKRGYEASMEGLHDEFEKLREDLKQTAEAFVTVIGPALEGFMKGLEKAASLVQSVVEGPIGRFLEAVAGFVAPLAGGAGAVLLFAGALVKLAGAFMLLRNSMSRGIIEGFQGKAGIGRTPEGIVAARGGGELGRTGAMLVAGAQPGAEKQSSWFQRSLYNIGQPIGAGVGAFRSGRAIPENWYAAREALSARIPWTEQYARPEVRTALSERVSRAAGWTVANLVTPQFDQMRHVDPAARRTWAQQEAPWIRAGTPSDMWETAKGKVSLLGGLTKSMGAVGLAETQMGQQRAEYARVQQDALISQQAREARLAELRQIHRETAEKRNAARAQERVIRDEIAQRGESAKATAQASRETKTFGQAMKGLAANVGGGLVGAGAAGLRGAWNAGMIGQAGGMAAAVAGGATGMNALMLGGTGAMIGSMVAPGIGTGIGATIGTGAGLAMDIAANNDSISESIKGVATQATEASKSGGGLIALHDATVQSQEDLDKWSESIGASGNQMDFWFGKPKLEYLKSAAPALKNLIEGALGTSEVEEQQQALDAEEEKARNVEAAFADLAKQGGERLTGSKTAQRAQIEQFMGTRGIAALGEAGIEIEDFVAARKAGGPEYQGMLEQAITPGKATGMWDRIRESEFGKLMLDDKTMQKSIALQGDIALAYESTNKVFEKMRASGMSYLDIVRGAERAQAEAGEEGRPEYIRAGALAQKAQYALQMQAPQLGRVGAVQQQLQLTQAVLATKPQTPLDAEERERQKQAAASAIADQDQFFRSLLLAQEAYKRSRERAQDDYALQRQYQEYDYNLSRTRAEESFNRMRSRAVADYHRNVERAWADFHLQRQRQEEDYQHQIDVTAQQQAISTNLYQRPETQRTSSATWLMVNTSDILDNLREQKKNLNRLRALGISDAVIQQLQLTDPANAQQLARFVTELESEQGMVGRFNRQARQMQRASRALVTDESSLEFQEMERSFRQSRERGLQDMQRSMKRQRQDFHRGLSQQREDFNIMMDDQAEDYEEQMKRQRKAYKTSMDRSAEDMAHMADEITGSITSVLKRAQRDLTGSGRELATQALQSFRDLRTSTRPEAIALMRELSEIFGFEYENPLKGGGRGGGGRAAGGLAAGAIAGAGGGAGGDGGAGAPREVIPTTRRDSPFHDGGTVPGWTPGRDTTTVSVSGGEAIMRPEWARAVGEGAINAMNHQAKYGGAPAPVRRGGEGITGDSANQAAFFFATGGVLSPERIAAARRAAMSQAGDPYVWGGVGPNGFDCSGFMSYITNVLRGNPNPHSRVGATASFPWAGFVRGPGQFTIGSSPNYGGSGTGHMAGTLTGMNVESRGGEGVVLGPDARGYRDSGFSEVYHLGEEGDFGGGFGGGFAEPPRRTARRVVRSVLKDLYPRAERAAREMSGVHPLKAGMISAIINRYARAKIRRLARRYGGGVDAGGVPTAPGNLSSNQETVRQAMLQAGFSANQWPSLYQLVMHESGFNNTAQNPTSTAYGMFQFLDSTWAGYGIPKTSDPWRQSVAGLRYVKGRYGSPRGAWDFWQNNNWYGDGAMFDQPNVIGVGEKGPEAVIPLDARGADFMAEVMAHTMGGRAVSPMRGSGTNIFARIDKSTNFTGPITVQASDPNEMLAKLQARQRVRALTKPAMSGSAA